MFFPKLSYYKLDRVPARLWESAGPGSGLGNLTNYKPEKNMKDILIYTLDRQKDEQQTS